jgi:hypothetical protein
MSERPETAKDALLAAAELLENGHRWMRGSYSRNLVRVKPGDQIPPDLPVDELPKVLCFCAVGAVAHVMGDVEEIPTSEQAVEGVRKMAETLFEREDATRAHYDSIPSEGVVTTWNDHYARTAEEVIALMREAAAKA